MPCVTLKNGVRIHFSDEAFKDKDYMKVVASEVSEEEPKILLSPEKEGRFKELTHLFDYKLISLIITIGYVLKASAMALRLFVFLIVLPG